MLVYASIRYSRFSERRLRDSSKRSSHPEVPSGGITVQHMARGNAIPQKPLPELRFFAAAWVIWLCAALDLMYLKPHVRISDEVSDEVSDDSWWYRYLMLAAFWSFGEAIQAEFVHSAASMLYWGQLSVVTFFKNHCMSWGMSWTSWSSTFEGWCTESPIANYHLNQRDYVT